MRRAAPSLAAALGVVAFGASALAHIGLPPEPHDLWTAWNPQPPTLLAALAATLLYARGFARSRRAADRAGGGGARTRARRVVDELTGGRRAGGVATRVRGAAGVPAVRGWQAACFAGGLAALLVALVSPLDALAASLLSAHMAQHLLLLVVAPALLVLSAPGYTLLWSLPRRARRALALAWNRSPAHAAWRVVAAALFSPLGALVVYTGVLWAWHAPDLYQAALAHEGVHLLEHASFLLASYPFWAVLLAPLGRHRANPGAGAAMLFGASVQGSALGALMALSPTPWYPAYLPTVAAWGLTPLQDQQLAGMVMWMPLGTLYVVLACLLLWLWLRDAESRRPAGQRLGAGAGGPAPAGPAPPSAPLVRATRRSTAGGE